MILYLIRHGETTFNAEDLVQGWTESDLNESGRRQAELIAKYLAEPRTRPTAIYASPLRRAADTARPTAEALGIAPVFDDDLREMRCGSWEGLRFEEVKVSRRDEYLSWAGSPDNPIPGGESMRDIYRRGSAALQRIIDRHGDEDRIAVFTHGGITRVLLAFTLGMDLQIARRCYQDNAAINRVVRRAGLFFLDRWNDTSHLLAGMNGRRPLSHT